MTRTHTSLSNSKSLNHLEPLFSLREQVGGPEVCIHPRGWKNQLFDSQTHPAPKVRDPGQVLCKGPDLFEKHFDVLSGGFLSEGSLPSQPPAPGATSRVDRLPSAQLFLVDAAEDLNGMEGRCHA